MSESFLKKLFVIYKNAHSMLCDRGYTLTHRIDDEETFINRYERNMIFIYDDNNTVVLHISKHNPTFDKRKTFIKKQYGDVIKSIKFTRTLKNIIIVTNTRVKSKMISYVLDDKNIKGKYNVSYIFSRLLMKNIPRHKKVPIHILLSDKEKSELLKTSTYKEEDLPKILETDPVAVWYGARHGSIFKIIRMDRVLITGKNERNDFVNNIEEIYYRITVADPDERIHI